MRDFNEVGKAETLSPSQTQAQVGLVEGDLGTYEKLLAQLEERLGDVLRPTYPDNRKEGEKVDKAEPLVPLAARINQSHQFACQLNTRLGQILERIEL